MAPASQPGQDFFQLSSGAIEGDLIYAIALPRIIDCRVDVILYWTVIGGLIRFTFVRPGLKKPSCSGLCASRRRSRIVGGRRPAQPGV